MFTRAEIKAQAKQQLKGKVWWLFLCTLIVSGLAMILGMIPVVGVIAVYVIAPPLSLGLIMVYLSVTYGEEVQINMLFDGFRNHNMGKTILLFLMVIFFTMLWSLLFVIPGIIKAYSYSMSFYILAENPDMTAREALNESKEIMKGNKLNFFILELSFFFWLLLVVVTFGIAAIYVEPYMQLTYANFYHNIKRQPAAEAVYEEPVYDAPVVETIEDVIE